MVKKYILKTLTPSGSKINLEGDLNSEQRDVVLHADGPSLVLAGAGSGKTRTLVYRVLYLMEKGILPENILFVTFTNKAAAQMKSRIEIAQGSHLTGLWCGTFHHVGLRVLRRYAKHIGLPESFGILDEEDARDLVRGCYDVLPFKASDVNFPKPHVLHRILSFASNVCEPVERVLEKRYSYFSSFAGEIKRIQAAYRTRKAASRNLDYDDLLIKWIELLNESVEVRALLTEQFRYCLVDEYQDTNALQHQLMQILSSKHQNLLVVGDDAQSIYSFRGATVQNILRFPKLYPEVKTFKLETNYRSTTSILTLANNSIQNNVRQFPKELKSVREGGSKPQLVRVRDAHEQSAFIAQRIQEYEDEGVELTDIAVLFRARYQAAELELELSKRKIPYVLRGGVRFFEQAHIKDVLSYLKIVENPQDELSWLRALRQYPGIGTGYASKLYREFMESQKDVSFIPSAAFGRSISIRARTGLARFKKTIQALLDPKWHDKPDALINHVLESGYAEYAKSHFENARDRIDDLHELVNFAHTYRSVGVFLSDLALRESFKGETLRGDPYDGRELVLSTIHQAKGLEWKVVILIGLNEGQFPRYQALDEDDELEEERRLFYVAATRAKDDLYLLHSMTRFQYDQGTVITRPSLFVTELSGGTYETAEIVRSQDGDDVRLDDFEESVEFDD